MLYENLKLDIHKNIHQIDMDIFATQMPRAFV